MIFTFIALAGCDLEYEHESDKHSDVATFATASENSGLTSANIRFFLVDSEELPDGITDYWRLDLSQIDHYHEFYNYEFSEFWQAHPDLARWEVPRIVFTTEDVVRDFRFLEIVPNHDGYWVAEEYIYEGARAYIVQRVLYYIDELVPGTPFIVTGANMGALFALNGFSFVDYEGVTRYFAFSFSYYIDPPPIILHEF